MAQSLLLLYIAHQPLTYLFCALNDWICGFTSREKRHLLVTGDFNLPHFDWSNSCEGHNDVPLSQMLLDIILFSDLSQVVKDPITDESLLEVSLVSEALLGEEYTSEVHEGIPDHDVVLFACSLNRHKSLPPVTTNIVYFIRANDGVLDLLHLG